MHPDRPLYCLPDEGAAQHPSTTDRFFARFAARPVRRPAGRALYSPSRSLRAPTVISIIADAERSRPTSPAPADLAGTWSRVQAHLRAAVPDRAFALWLTDLRPLDLQRDRIVVSAPAHTCPWIGARFGRALDAAATAVLGVPAHVELVPDGSPREPSDRRGEDSRSPLLAFRELPLNPKFTFDHFVIGDGNRLAHGAALAVAELPGQAYNPLFIYGPPGLGKTHLLQAITAYLQRYNPSLTVRSSTIEDFTSDFTRALKTEAMPRFKAHYRDVDVLIVDDIQFLQSKVRTEEEFLHTFNALYDTGCQLVLASDRLPRDMTELEDRLCERFVSGLVTDIQPPDFDTRVAILRKRAAHDAIELKDEGPLELIAGRVTDNVRALEGALIRLIAYQSLTGAPITHERTLALLDRLYPAPPRRCYSIAQIQRATSAAFDVSVDDLRSRSRAARVTQPRQLAMFLSRGLTDTTLPAIGQEFGGRDHTTVMHACRRVERALVHDSSLRAALARVRALLDEPKR